MKNNQIVDQLITDAKTELSKDDFDSALALLEKAVIDSPDNAEVLFLLGIIAYTKSKYDEAVDYFKNSNIRDPNNPKTLFNYATALNEIGHYSDALKNFNQILALEPDHVPAMIKCSAILGKMGFVHLAEQMCRHSLQLDPDNLDAHINMANSLREQGRIEESLSWFKQSLAISPDDDLAHSSYLLSLNYSDCDQQYVFEEHRKWGLKKEKSFHINKAPHVKHSPSKRKFRIGYISEDFRTHSVGYFIEPIIACHNKNEFEVFCYSNSSNIDETTERIRSQATHWRSIFRVDDATACSMIHKDAIDILVDCAGHTGNNRLSLFSMRPAPVQITYLGYPNTTGLPAIDYRLTDGWADPEGQDIYYTEKLYRLSNCFLCYRPPQSIPPITEFPIYTNGFVTFGSFNNLPKINTHVIKIWAGILQVVPEARLVIKTKQFNDEKVIARYEKLFIEHGIAKERLLFHGYSRSQEEHLAAYNQIDIALDTFPYNGTTTTCEALLMGVPVIALAGTRHAGRVGVSILTQTGLTKYLAQDEEEYIAKAISCAHTLTHQSNTRQETKETFMSSPLCDGKMFTRYLEAAYKDMYDRLFKEYP